MVLILKTAVSSNTNLILLLIINNFSLLELLFIFIIIYYDRHISPTFISLISKNFSFSSSEVNLLLVVFFSFFLKDQSISSIQV